MFEGVEKIIDNLNVKRGLAQSCGMMGDRVNEHYMEGMGCFAREKFGKQMVIG